MRSVFWVSVLVLTNTCASARLTPAAKFKEGRVIGIGVGLGVTSYSHFRNPSEVSGNGMGIAFDGQLGSRSAKGFQFGLFIKGLAFTGTSLNSGSREVGLGHRVVGISIGQYGVERKGSGFFHLGGGASMMMVRTVGLGLMLGGGWEVGHHQIGIDFLYGTKAEKNAAPGLGGVGAPGASMVSALLGYRFLLF